MSYQSSRERLGELRRQIATLRQEMRGIQQTIEPQPISQYAFQLNDRTVTLAELFGAGKTLFVIHNMGAGCAYCTLWADGFNGVYEHLRSRAAFVVASPDSPDRQQAFARSRGWKFPMISYAGSSFAEDMGYQKNGGFGPGVSVLQRRDSGIVRVSDLVFGPGDDFCSVWHFFDLLPEGPDGWQPKFRYPALTT